MLVDAQGNPVDREGHRIFLSSTDPYVNSTPGDVLNIAVPKGEEPWHVDDPSGRVLTEDGYLIWTDQDKYVMSVLIGQGYITVHSGGYMESMNMPRSHPGPLLAIHSREDVSAAVAGIVAHGGKFEITKKGYTAGVWTKRYGFCVSANSLSLPISGGQMAH